MVSSRTGQWLAAAWRSPTSTVGLFLELLGIGPDVDPHVKVTFRAIADAVVPETSELAADLGPEHVLPVRWFSGIE
jgi:hypothetical protein